MHPLLGAVHVAFAEHRPLVLSPDVVRLTILAGVTQHVRLNAERLRDRFVRHRDKKRFEVIVHVSLREQPAAINEVVPRFRELLAKEVGQGTARLLTCDFSTTTDVERMASEIMLMDTFSPYFQYDVACVCGIPELTLLGEPDDWQQIRERVRAACSRTARSRSLTTQGFASCSSRESSSGVRARSRATLRS